MKTQIWISICVYVLVAIVKKELKTERSLSSILQILSVNAFQKVPLDQLLMETPLRFEEGDLPKQLAFNW